MFLIDDDNDDQAFPGGVRYGLVPRDYRLYPEEMFAPPSELNLIPRSEWSDRIKDKVAAQSRLSDIRGNLVGLDQKSDGYCWAYSTGQANVLIRAVNNQPYVRLNPHAVAAIIKGGRNEGGWCGLSAKFLREIGIPSEEFWPANSRDLGHDTPAMRANAARHKVTEDWVDLARSVYDQNLTFEQVATCLLTNVPCAVDFNWWSHSVCAMDLVEVEPGDFGIRIWNSWGDGWGERGTAILRGSKCIPDGAVALRVSGASG